MRTLTANGLAAIALWASFVVTGHCGEHHTLRFNERSGLPAGAACMCISPDSKELVLATNSYHLHFIRIQDGETVRKLEGVPWGMTYSADGSRILTVGSTESKLYEARTGKPIPLEVSTDSGMVGMRLVEKNGKLVIDHLLKGGPAASSGKLKLGDEVTGYANGMVAPMTSVLGSLPNKVADNLRGIPESIVRVEFIAKGKEEPEVLILKRKPGKLVGERVEFSDERAPRLGERLMMAASSGYLTFRSAYDGNVVGAVSTESINQRGQNAFSPDGRQFLFLSTLISDSNKIGFEIFDVATLTRVLMRPFPRDSYFQVRYQPDGKYFLIASRTQVDCFNAKDGEFSHAYLLDGTMTKSQVRPIESTPEQVAEAKSKAEVVADPIAGAVLNARRDELGTFRTPNPSPKAVLIAASDSLLATASQEGEITIWRLEDGKEVERFPAKKEQSVQLLEFTPDGKWLAFFRPGVLHLVEMN